MLPSLYTLFSGCDSLPLSILSVHSGWIIFCCALAAAWRVYFVFRCWCVAPHLVYCVCMCVCFVFFGGAWVLSQLTNQILYCWMRYNKIIECFSFALLVRKCSMFMAYASLFDIQSWRFSCSLLHSFAMEPTKGKNGEDSRSVAAAHSTSWQTITKVQFLLHCSEGNFCLSGYNL